MRGLSRAHGIQDPFFVQIRMMQLYEEKRHFSIFSQNPQLDDRSILGIRRTYWCRDLYIHRICVSPYGSFHQLCIGKWHQKVKANLDGRNPDLPMGDFIKNFVESLDGKSSSMRIWVGDRIQTLKQKIEKLMVISAILSSLIFAGKLLQEDFKLQDYGIERDSTIILNMRLLYP